MPSSTDTIAALATPSGTAALAVVRLSGPDTLTVATALAGRPPLPRHATYLDYHDSTGRLIDDVVLTFFAGPNSYTGEDAAELTCHGNPYIAQRILEDMFARGCRPAGPGEFTQRAFLNGRMDLSQAEAVMDVIHARSERALSAAQDQLRGSLGRRIQQLVESLLAILARVEAYIDFPDEDLPAEDRQQLVAELERLGVETDRLLATSHYGEILRDGIKTVIVGRPNVGKSSLMNRLVGRDRALVSPEPGTTRDFIEERITVGAFMLRIIDTAGLNPSPTPLEQLGMERTRERLAEADLILYVTDGSQPVEPIPADIQARLAPANSLIILNKSDLCDNSTRNSPSAHPMDLQVVDVSALTGTGFDKLASAISKIAEGFQRNIGDDQIAVSARHAFALEEARAGIRRSLDQLKLRGEMELVASDLRIVQAAFGEITGKIDNERMLDHLFATFCIGK